MPETIYDPDPLAGAYPRAAKDILPQPPMFKPEPVDVVDMDMVQKSINNFSGTDKDEAQALVNMYAGGKLGALPKPEDYKANMNSYLYPGAADNDPIKNLELIRKGFVPEEDKANTALIDYEALDSAGT